MADWKPTDCLICDRLDRRRNTALREHNRSGLADVRIVRQRHYREGQCGRLALARMVA
ncbi:hypothetical protein ACIRBX_12160 [Kitasatospora sp. NPDC096147]|uniref:hypothetical protein n=1 Tax=Kitasatospora sp. NPDC096147 TaxID=3364093 RepID=UPI0037FAD2E6